MGRRADHRRSCRMAPKKPRPQIIQGLVSIFKLTVMRFDCEDQELLSEKFYVERMRKQRVKIEELKAEFDATQQELARKKL